MEKKANKEMFLEGKFSLEDLWNEGGEDLTAETFRELVRLGKRIDGADKKKRRISLALSTFSVAAALVAVSCIAFSVARKNFETSPLEHTRNLVADYGETEFITLSDGTEVHLNSGSTLVYPESFCGGSRMVFLTGEGNFTVAKDAERPFVVKTAYMDVEALGTVFCIQSLAGEHTVRTTLSEGKVRVSIPSTGKSYILEPDMQLVYNSSDNAVSFAKVDPGKVLGWQDGYLSFVNASFDEIVSVLERRFDVSIRYNSNKMQRNSLNVRFMPDETLEDALNVLTILIPGSRYRKEGDWIFWQF